MDWITVTWPVMGAVCLTLGLIHLLLCFTRGWHAAHLMFAVTAFSVMAISVYELVLFYAPTAEAYATALRHAQVPGASMFIGMTLFVHLQFGGFSRRWLVLAAIATRLAALVANFTTGVNLNYTSIESLRSVSMWGVTGVTAIGHVNPWMAIGQLNILLVIVYLLDTAHTAWRHGKGEERARAVRVCLAMALFTLLATAWRVGVIVAGLHAPDLLIPSFLCVMLIMSYELSSDLLHSRQLAADLSQRTQQLRESEIRADVAVHAARLGLWRWDLGSDRVWLSDYASELLGQTPGPLDIAFFRERVPHRDRRQLARAVAAARNGAEMECEFRMDGESPRWFVVRGRIGPDRAGVPRQLQGALADVTERRLGEERFQLAVEASPTAMLLVGEDGKIGLANGQAEAVFGYPREELVGLGVEQLLPPQLREAHAAMRHAYAAAPAVRVIGADRDLFAQCKDGTQVQVEIALNPIRTRAGRVTLVSVADVGERTRLKRESELHREELAHLSRVALLAELSGSLAHELNQPLTAILSNAQAAVRFMAMSPPELGEVRTILSDIVDSDKRAGEVIRRMRAMLRKEPSNHEPLDINGVIRDVLRIVRSDLLNRNTALDLDLATGLPPTFGDGIQLQQVLLNLLMNGCDAMSGLDPGSRVVAVRTSLSIAGDIEVAVVDRGTGIPPDSLERIFSPFVTSKPTGLGLGLAVCTTIIESHGGRLWATNNHEAGATIHFTLPGVPVPGAQGQ